MSGTMRYSAVTTGVMLFCLMWSSAHALERELDIQGGDTRNLELDDTSYPTFYLGAGFGKVYDSDQYDYARDHNLYKAFLGTSFSRYFGTELTLLKIEDTGDGQGNYAVQLNNYSWSLAGVATLPLTQHFEIGLKLGYANNASSTSTSTTSGFGNGGWTYGVFITANITDHIGLRAEYEGMDFGNYFLTSAALSGIYKF